MDVSLAKSCLARALVLAARGEGHTRPNPPVGAVVVCGGQIVGEGWHRRAGGAHAEVAALQNACRRGYGQELRGASIVVTLEPCSKPGLVGACTDALARAGVREVFYAIPDPNPRNRGRARRVLAKAGIPCVCLASNRQLAPLIARARALIAPFAHRVATGLPLVTVKLAMSLDGRVCDDAGRARWISSASSRRQTGLLRERVDAIMVGAETVRRDNPSLLSHGKRNDDLLRVVISRSGRLPKQAQIFTDGAPNETLVFDDPLAALKELGRRGCLQVLCEGGLSLVRSLADAHLVDRWIAVNSPIVIGNRPLNKALRLGKFDIIWQSWEE